MSVKSCYERFKNYLKKRKLKSYFSKYISKDDMNEIIETFNSGSDDIIGKLNKKAKYNTYEILVLYTKESQIQKWLEKIISRLTENNYMISDFFGNFLFAYRKCDDEFDEARIKTIIDDDTKIAVFIKNTRIINLGTNESLRFNPEISFNEDFLSLFAGLKYGEYMLMSDETGSEANKK